MNYERMHKTYTNSHQTKMPAWRNRHRHKVPLLYKKLCTWYLLREQKPGPSNGVAPSRSVTLQVRSQAQKQLTNTKQTPSFLWNSLSYYWTIFVFWFCFVLLFSGKERERKEEGKRGEKENKNLCGYGGVEDLGRLGKQKEYD